MVNDSGIRTPRRSSHANRLNLRAEGNTGVHNGDDGDDLEEQPRTLGSGFRDTTTAKSYVAANDTLYVYIGTLSATKH